MFADESCSSGLLPVLLLLVLALVIASFLFVVFLKRKNVVTGQDADATHAADSADVAYAAYLTEAATGPGAAGVGATDDVYHAVGEAVYISPDNVHDNDYHAIGEAVYISPDSPYELLKSKCNVEFCCLQLQLTPALRALPLTIT